MTSTSWGGWRLTAGAWHVSLAALASTASLGLGAAPQVAPMIAPERAPLTSGQGFPFKEKTRQAVSGIACAVDGTARRCLVVFDEGVEAQFATLGADSLMPTGEPIALLRSGGELDAEGAATDGEYFYVMGSHSVKRKDCKSNPSSRHVVRFRARWMTTPAVSAPQGGRPPQLKVTDLEQTGRLWDLIGRDPFLGSYADGCLGAGKGGRPEQMKHRPGINIEGLAAKDGRLYVGFRGPSLDGVVPVYSVEASALFDGTDAKPRLARLRVGNHLGIRDMAAGEKAILLLLGPDDYDPAGRPTWLVAEWKPGAAVPSSIRPAVLAILDLSGVRFDACFKELKPEALSILEETANSYRIVVMSDGVCDGGPLIFRVPK